MRDPKDADSVSDPLSEREQILVDWDDLDRPITFSAYADKNHVVVIVRPPRYHFSA